MTGSSYFSPMLRGIENEVSHNGMALLIFSTQTSSKSLLRFGLPLGEHNTGGLIIYTNNLNEEDLARLHKRRLPMLLLNQTPPPAMNIPCVTVENKAGFRRLVTHIIETHHCCTIGNPSYF